MKKKYIYCTRCGIILIFKRTAHKNSAIHTQFENSNEVTPVHKYEEITLAYILKPGLHISRRIASIGLRTCFSSCPTMVWSPCGSNDRKY